jgi:hypothetical protein
VRLDVVVLSCFRMLNQLWAEANIGLHTLPVSAGYYGVCPVGGERLIGVMEYVDGCVPLKRVKSVASTHQARDRMAVSAAGGYLGAYILGVRDRHWDNIIVKEDGALYHIDFSRVLGESVTVDTADFALTPDLKEWLGPTHWGLFLDLTVQAFVELRKNLTTVVPFISMMFAALYRAPPRYTPAYCAPATLHAASSYAVLSHKPPPNAARSLKEVEAFLHASLMMHLDTEAACTKLRRLLERGPKHFKTRFKNAIHGVATGMKS